MDQLSTVIFPLGGLRKEEVKAMARELGWNDYADKKESQDFLECGDYSVLFDESDNVPGDFVDLNGKVLGKHKGIVHYTIDDTHLDLRIRFFNHRAAEVVGRPKLRTLAMGQRRNRLDPFSLGRVLVTGPCICRPEQLEAFVDRLVLLADIALALHVGLAKRKIDVEIGIRCGKCSRNHQGGKAQMQDFHLNLLKQRNTVTRTTAENKITFFGATLPFCRLFPL